jgi:hypothetical protein
VGKVAPKKRVKVPGGRGGGPVARETLLDRYRTILVDKMTADDLRELQSFLRKEVDERGILNRVYREKFAFKLRQFLHEEILTREIVGIEALIRELKPGDLKR